MFSRRIVGWRVDDNMEDDLVIIPLRNALQSRQPLPGLITHSDRGGQYVSNDLHKLISLWKIRPSMSRADDPYKNAFAESFGIGPPKRPLESGIIGRRYISKCGRCSN
ncbi:DDE-type integrase/transposase/recombinase [Spirosoma soli]|uniref:DDE-type integrase/transposase/recombinase n=1 Tax=Spirosoma soli TaxID=1770529 RepID=A0ABW5M4C2_9BACT